MKHANTPEVRPNGLTQKVTGVMDWSAYMDFLDHIKRTREGKDQMAFVGEAVTEKVQREKAAR